MKRIITCLTLCLSTLSFAKESNKTIVVNFYKIAFVDHKPKEAAEKYINPAKYIQHNPHVPDGRQPFIDYFVPYFAKNKVSPSKIVRVIADGDLVALHVHSKKNDQDRGRAIVDIFRVENGKIVEHWDVIQEVPEKSENKNTMF